MKLNLRERCKAWLKDPSSHLSEKLQAWLPPALVAAWKSHPPLFRWRATSVFVLVFLWNISISTNFLSALLEYDNPVCATLNEVRDLNLHIQLRLYQALAQLRFGSTPVSTDVTLVAIDNSTHWTLLHGETPTNRSILAALVRNLTYIHPTVIGLDFELLAPILRSSGDDETREDDNRELLQAIQDATKKGIPVVLGGAYVPHGNKNIRVPEIFREEDLQPPGWDCSEKPCSTFGFVNTPSDRRLIPTTVKVESTAGTTVLMDSFALAVAKASRGPLITLPKLHQLEEEPTFGTFLREDPLNPPFHKVLAVDILNPDASGAHSLDLCRDQIVIVGGTWHEVAGYGAQVDYHLSAAGMTSGLGLEANYVESLLNPDENSREVPLWLDIFADLILGFGIYATFLLFKGRLRAGILIAAAVTPIAAAWFFLVGFHRFFDFLFPIELYVLHVAYELFEEHHTHKSQHQADKAPLDAAQLPSPTGVGL